MTTYQLLMFLSKLYNGFYSTERRNEKASGSELRRWIKKSSVEINGYTDTDPNEIIDYPIKSVIIHPKSSKHRSTLLWSYK